MRLVPVKTAERQAALMLVGLRDRLIRNRTQLANAIRGYAAEFGLAAAKGIAHLVPLLDRRSDLVSNSGSRTQVTRAAESMSQSAPIPNAVA
jgi:transposase